MDLAIADLIGTFLLQSSGASVVGLATTNVATKLLLGSQKSSLESLYTDAILRACNAFTHEIHHHLEPESQFRADKKALTRLLQARFEVGAVTPSSITDEITVRALTSAIEEFLILPGSQLTKQELELLATRILRESARLLMDDIARNEVAFRRAMLEESITGTIDRKDLQHSIDQILHTLRMNAAQLDVSMTVTLQKIREYLAAIEDKGRDPSISWNDLLFSCQNRISRVVHSTPKYISDLTIARVSIETEFRKFRRSDFSVLMLLGEAGSGKSNIVYKLASEYSANSAVVFLKGTTIYPGRLGIHRALSEELSAILGRAIEPFSIIPSLHDAASRHESNVLVFIDGINENRDFTEAMESLTYFAEDLQRTSIKLCVTCRDVHWRHSSTNGALTRLAYKSPGADSPVEGAIEVTGFTDQEVDSAWEKYSRFYCVRGSLSNRVREMCRHPLMLRLVSEAFQGRYVPPDVRQVEVFDKYWDEKVSGEYRTPAGHALHSLASHLMRTQQTELAEDEAIEIVGDVIFKRLISDQLLVYTSIDSRFREAFVGFTYDAFLEYLIARQVRRQRSWRTSNVESQLETLMELVQDSNTFYTYFGALKYLLGWCEDEILLGRVINELVNRDAAWKLFCCDILSTRGIASDHAIASLEILCADDDPRVRWGAGTALGLLSQRTDAEAIAKTLQGLSVSNPWTKREAAAVALGEGSDHLEDSLSGLHTLATDLNWRVRRAAGYSVGHLSLTDPLVVIRRMEEWSNSSNWRARQAAAKSQRVMTTQLPESLSLLSQLCADSNDEVRWIVMASLVSLSWLEDTSPEVAKLLFAFSGDSSMFVRKQLTASLAELWVSLGGSATRLAGDLARDDDYRIRWELARVLGATPRSNPSLRILESLCADEHPDVSLAALYSMGSTAVSSLPSRLLGEKLPLIDHRLLRERFARVKRVGSGPELDSELMNSWKGDRYSDLIAIVKTNTSTIGDRADLLEFLTLLFDDQDEGIRWAIASAIPQLPLLHSSDRVDISIRLMTDPHYWVRREAVGALRKILSPISYSHNKVIRTALMQALVDPESEVRYAAVESAMVLGAQHRDVLDAVHALATDADPQVRGLVRSLGS